MGILLSGPLLRFFILLVGWIEKKRKVVVVPMVGKPKSNDKIVVLPLPMDGMIQISKSRRLFRVVNMPMI